MNISTISVPQQTELQDGFSAAFYDKVEDLFSDIPLGWSAPDLFLQQPYLTALEENPPLGMKFLFILFRKNTRVVGLAACQILHFKGGKSLHFPQKTSCFVTALGNYLKKSVANKVEFDTLICGSLLLTGEHGFWVENMEREAAHALMEAALTQAQNHLNEQGTKVTATVVKDYYTPSESLVSNGFVEYVIQPNMLMKLSQNWKKQEDYLSDLQSKYRIRAKRAFKRLEPIEKRVLSATNLAQEAARIYELYQNIASEAGFNTIQLHPNYLVELKKYLPEAYQVVGYYLDNQLIAFYSTIKNGDELEAHFLGYDKTLNPEKQIYLNMLFDIIATGIEQQASSIVFARTASEIKSSVGAVAHEMFCYLRHHKPLTNRLLGTIFDYLNPEEEWLPRHPFKS